MAEAYQTLLRANDKAIGDNRERREAKFTNFIFGHFLKVSAGSHHRRDAVAVVEKEVAASCEKWKGNKVASQKLGDT